MRYLIHQLLSSIVLHVSSFFLSALDHQGNVQLQASSCNLELSGSCTNYKSQSFVALYIMCCYTIELNE